MLQAILAISEIVLLALGLTEEEKREGCTVEQP